MLNMNSNIYSQNLKKMCDLEREFKLCTCDFDMSKSRYTWKLFRKNRNKIEVIVGQYFIPEIDWHQMILPQKIEQFLNQAQENNMLFDKDIEVYDKDRLVFYNKGQVWLQFESSMCRWWLKKSNKEPKYHMVNNGNILETNA